MIADAGFSLPHYCRYVRADGYFSIPGRGYVVSRVGRPGLLEGDPLQAIPALPTPVDVAGVFEAAASPAVSVVNPPLWATFFGRLKRALRLTRRSRSTDVRADLYDAFEAWGR